MVNDKPNSDMMEDSENIEAKKNFITYEEEVDSNCEAEDIQEYSTILIPRTHDEQGLGLNDETEDEEELELTSCSISTTSSEEVTIQCTKHNKETPDDLLESCSKEIEGTVDKLAVTEDRLEATKDKIKGVVNESVEVNRIKAVPSEPTESQLVNPQQQSTEIECDLNDTEINHGNQDSTGNTPQNQHGKGSPAEEVDDDQETLESEKILFADSFFKYLDKRTERGKTNFKWDGKPTELHDFITLVLKRNGQMKSRKAGGGKQMHFFQDKPANVTINFWQTSKTLSIQGNQIMTKKIIDKLERIVKEMKPESAAKTSNANANDEIPQTKASTPKKTKKKKITTDEELVISKSQLEPPLNRKPSDDIAKLWEAINEMKSLLLKSWTTNTSIREASVVEPQGTSLHNRIKHLEDDKIKLTDELEQARALNMELLRTINSQPFSDTEGVNYKAKINSLEAELTHTKALNKELIELLNKKFAHRNGSSQPIIVGSQKRKQPTNRNIKRLIKQKRQLNHKKEATTTTQNKPAVER